MQDFWYYQRRLLERELELDDQKVKEHFPVSKVVPAILEIYQKLLGVQFVEVKGAKLWHPGACGTRVCVWLSALTLTLRRRGAAVRSLGRRC